MKPFFALLGLSFKNILQVTLNMGFGKNGKSQKSVSGLFVLVFIGLLTLFISSVYSFPLAFALAPLGGLDIMLMMVLAFALFFPFFFIMFGAQSLVFSAKDVDFVLSLPVSAFSVMLARVMALYLEALFISELIVLPAGIAYLVFGGQGGAAFLLLLIIVAAFGAFVPTLLALLLAMLVVLVVSRLPFKNLFIVLFSLLGVLGIMAISMSLSFSMNYAQTASIGALRGILLSFPPLAWGYQSTQGNLLSLILWVAVTALPFLGLVWVFSPFYKTTLTRLASRRLRTNYKLRRVGSKSSLFALINKEAKKFFGTPMYVLNAGMGLLLALIGSVAAVFYKGSIQSTIAVVAAQEGIFNVQGLLAPLLAGALCVMCGMTFISCVSISLEGKNLWILKASPVSASKIFYAKAGFSLLLETIILLICVPLLGWAFSISAVEVLLIGILAFLYSAATSFLGVLINLLFPRLDAENEVIVIKQSAATLVSMLADWLILGLFSALFVIMNLFGLGFGAFTVAAGGCLVLVVALTLRWLNTAGCKRFAAL